MAFDLVAVRVAIVAQVLGDSVCPAVGDTFVGRVEPLIYVWSLGCAVVVVGVTGGFSVSVVGGVAGLVMYPVQCVLLESCLDDAFDIICSDIV